MRLIDADVALQRFIKEAETSGKGCIHINTIKRLLQDIDTAYDIEKVVKSLKNHPNVFQEFKGCYIPLENAVEVVESNDGKGWWNE